MTQVLNTKYDLEERTARFAEEIIDFVRTIKQDAVNRRIIDQLVGAAGSIGANYCEEEIRKFWQEAHELLLIFSKISRSSRGA